MADVGACKFMETDKRSYFQGHTLTLTAYAELQQSLPGLVTDMEVKKKQRQNILFVTLSLFCGCCVSISRSGKSVMGKIKGRKERTSFGFGIFLQFKMHRKKLLVCVLYLERFYLFCLCFG